MSTQTISLFDKALKDIYIGPIRDQLNRASVIHDLLRKDADAILGGRRARIPVLVAGNTGTGSRSETGTLPTAGYQDVQEAIVPLKYHFGRIQISDAVMEASRTDRMAFRNAFTVETEGLIKDVKDMIGRQTFNDGTPTLAVIAAGDAGSGTTVTFSGARHRRVFQNGQKIDVISGDETTEVASSRSISSVTYTTDTSGTFVVSGAGFSRAAGDRIVFEDAMTAGANPVYHEMTGLGGAIGAGAYGLPTYFGLSGSSYPVWQSKVINGAAINGGDLVDEHLQEGADEVERDSGEQVDCIVTTYAVRKKYLASLQADKRFLDNELSGGWSALGFQSGNGLVPVYVEKWCTPATAYGLSKKFWAVYRMADFGWLDRDGAALARVPNQAVYEATMRYYAEIGCSKRNANYRIHSLNEA